MSRAMSANSLGALLDMAEPTTLERDEFAARWAKWQTAVSLLRATASMMMMPVVPGILRASYGALGDGVGAAVAKHSADVAFYGAAAQLACLPIAGALSDGRLGRKPVALLCVLAQVASALCVYLAATGACSAGTVLAAQVAAQVGAILGAANASASVADVHAHDPSKIAATAGAMGGATMGDRKSVV